MSHPKGSILVGTQRLIDRLVELGTGFGDVVLVGRDPGYGVTRPRLDDAEGVEGPLGGLLGLLAFAGPRPAFALSCDLPFVDAATLAALEARATAGVSVVARRDLEAPLEPFVARYAPSALVPLRDAATRGERSVQRALRDVPHVVFLPDDPHTLDDWDTPDDVLRGGGRLPPG